MNPGRRQEYVALPRSTVKRGGRTFRLLTPVEVAQWFGGMEDGRARRKLALWARRAAPKAGGCAY